MCWVSIRDDANNATRVLSRQRIGNRESKAALRPNPSRPAAQSREADLSALRVAQHDKLDVWTCIDKVFDVLSQIPDACADGGIVRRCIRGIRESDAGRVVDGVDNVVCESEQRAIALLSRTADCDYLHPFDALRRRVKCDLRTDQRQDEGRRAEEAAESHRCGAAELVYPHSDGDTATVSTASEAL